MTKLKKLTGHEIVIDVLNSDSPSAYEYKERADKEYIDLNKLLDWLIYNQANISFTDVKDLLLKELQGDKP